jgi:hypothetical protein
MIPEEKDETVRSKDENLPSKSKNQAKIFSLHASQRNSEVKRITQEN